MLFRPLPLPPDRVQVPKLLPVFLVSLPLTTVLPKKLTVLMVEPAGNPESEMVTVSSSFRFWTPAAGLNAGALQ